MFTRTANKHPLLSPPPPPPHLQPHISSSSSFSPSLEVRGGRRRGEREKMLTVALSPVKRPPSLLSRLTRYHANAHCHQSLCCWRRTLGLSLHCRERADGHTLVYTVGSLSESRKQPMNRSLDCTFNIDTLQVWV